MQRPPCCHLKIIAWKILFMFLGCQVLKIMHPRDLLATRLSFLNFFKRWMPSTQFSALSGDVSSMFQTQKWCDERCQGCYFGAKASMFNTGWHQRESLTTRCAASSAPVMLSIFMVLGWYRYSCTPNRHGFVMTKKTKLCYDCYDFANSMTPLV